MDEQCTMDYSNGLEDMEDMFGGDVADGVHRRMNKENIVVPKVKKRAANKQVLESGPRVPLIPRRPEVNDEVNENDGVKQKTAEQSRSAVESSFLPGTHSVYLKTWGCTHNSSDSEYMAGQLAQQGYKITDSKGEADVWILNSCTVKSPAEDHFRNEVNRGLDDGKKVVVAGCVPQGKPDAEYIRGLSVVGVQQIDRVVEVVEETLKGNQVRLFGQKKVRTSLDDGDESGGKTIRKGGGASLALPKVRRNPLVEIIAINTGCLNQCTYCKTKHARGELGSYPIEEIVDRAVESFKEGVVEIWLTSEDTGAYGRDIGVTLPDLLWKLVEVIPDGCRLRIGMTNPPYILDHLDEIGKVLNHPNVYKFMHIPVQSGSDAVLSDMKREYKRSDFTRVVDTLRKDVPGVSIATDVICGFPTETDPDFQDTLSLCRDYQFPSLFINQFYPRPGTPAAQMKRVTSTKDVKKRTKAVTDVFHSYEPYTGREGSVYRVLVTDVSHDGRFLVGHNDCYEQVLVPKDDDLMGKLVTVRVTETSKFSMVGKLVSDATSPTSFKPLIKGQVSTSGVDKAKGKGSLADKPKIVPTVFNSHSLVYVGSLILLGLAVLVRLFQLVNWSGYASMANRS